MFSQLCSAQVDMTDADNAGLAQCLYQGEFGVSIADAYADFCTSISLADFLVVAAEAVMGASRKHVTDADSSRSPIDFKSKFKFGRTTAKSCASAHGRLPNPENSCAAVQETFVESMGLSWAQAAALMGVHTLGRAQISNSGYNGWWSSALQSRNFNNDYFVSILAKGWGPEVAVAGNTGKNQWQRIDAGADEAGLGKEMMLDTDLCLAFTMDDAGQEMLNAATAQSQGCECTWVAPVSVSAASSKYEEGRFCGSTDIPGKSNFRQQRALCCGAQFNKISDAAIDWFASKSHGPSLPVREEICQRRGCLDSSLPKGLANCHWKRLHPEEASLIMNMNFSNSPRCILGAFQWRKINWDIIFSGARLDRHRFLPGPSDFCEVHS